MSAATPASGPQVAAPKRRTPIVGDDVHFFDETRAQAYSKPGLGPYAAKVVLIDVTGVVLKVFAPHAVFDVAGVPHKSELDAKSASRKKWWDWPERK